MSGASEAWSPDDPRLKPLLPSQYTFHPIPPSPSPDAKWDLSVLDSSSIKAPRHDFCSFAEKDELTVVPAFSSLLEREGEAVLFDLGLREDPENFMPVSQPILKRYQAIPAPGPIKRLQAGGFDTTRIKQTFISHMHFDHYGDLGTLRDIQPLIVFGQGTLARIGAGYPEDEESPWPSEWLKELNIVDLSDLGALEEKGGEGRADGGARKWERVACFDQALDWFGDGSLWLVAAPGHCVGHMMGLVRVTTSPDTYVLLSGDSAHAQECYLPVPPPPDDDTPDHLRDPRAPRSVQENGKASMTEDPARSAFDVGSLTRMSMEDNVMVLLAHESGAEAILPRWPDAISAWKEKGWKEEKQREVYAAARRKGFKV